MAQAPGGGGRAQLLKYLLLCAGRKENGDPWGSPIPMDENIGSLLVDLLGGLEHGLDHFFILPYRFWEESSSQVTHIFFRWVGQPPSRLDDNWNILESPLDIHITTIILNV